MRLIDYFYYNRWNTHTIKYLGGAYATLDMVSILRVEKMQINTILHHIIVQFLYLISLFLLDFNVDTIARGVVIYAVFSTFAFTINILIFSLLHALICLACPFVFSVLVFVFCY